MNDSICRCGSSPRCRTLRTLENIPHINRQSYTSSRWNLIIQPPGLGSLVALTIITLHSIPLLQETSIWSFTQWVPFQGDQWLNTALARICLALQRTRSSKKQKDGAAGNRTPDLSHAKGILYH
ncbi:uncharacterized protein BP01DRAFT_175785 [Aspergillus saccharolyticus JOP 1030-1]|uniref:Uncharacterized protein n=1 Tax=Aspergillus saccharolyticus JOP 1030-1 TaxID=1450539 RepID=A0A318ZKF5_9EURO|nr:hypothetical protein BP01DRAFT_175785 [Aspergillus saccharolyticus JOP 1030-1]PYH48071.1 hypothetical protein BP01DRAFT_175785 [Aspergillus saccharolyticus JOP 1030-1]